MSSRKGRFLIFSTGCLVGLGLIGNASGQFSFDPVTTLPTGQRPNDIAAGDWDGDGDLDLAVTTDGNGNQDLIELYINNAGVYSAGGIIVLPNSSSPGELEAADFDGDGDIDMAVVLRDFNQVMTVINNGGAFSLGATASVGSNARGMSQRDMEGDGDIDLVLANRDSNTATVLANSGGATFSSTTLTVGDEPRAATYVDINGDALLDVAVTNHRDRTVSLFTNTGGGFSPAGTLSTGADLRPEGIIAADLNSDGFEDLASATGDPERASVWLNTGGAFGARADYPTGGIAASQIVAADLDLDGDLDLVITLNDSNQASVLPNTGAGAFGAATMLTTGTRPGNVLAADLDSNGGADLLIVNRDSNNVSIFMNQKGGPVFADLTAFEILVGTYTSGGLNELGSSDDAALQARSGFGSQLTDLHNMTMSVTGNAGGTSASTVTVSVESRISSNAGSVQVYLADWTAGGQPISIGSRAVGMTDSVHTFDPQDASRFVSGTGEVRVTLKYVVHVPFLAFQFDTFVDQVAIELN